jgi:hypothetical protein
VKIFQTFESVPSRIAGLLHVLRREPGNWAERTVVVDLLQPAPIRTGQGTDPINEVIGAALELGVVLEDRTDRTAPKLRIADAFVAGDTSAFAERLPRLLAEAALTPKSQGESNQFARACAWLLLQDPLAMPQGYGDFKRSLTDDGLDLDELGLKNDQRWDMLLYWSTYLGLTWQTREQKCVGVVADPSTYLLRHLDEVVARDEVMPVHQFREKLGSLCPVLDGGSVHREIAATMVRTGVLTARLDDRLSAALSFTLRYLRAMEVIDYWCPDDQRTFLLMSGDEKIAFVSRRARVTA